MLKSKRYVSLKRINCLLACEIFLRFTVALSMDILCECSLCFLQCVIYVINFFNLPFKFDQSFVCSLSNHAGQGYDGNIFSIREAVKKVSAGWQGELCLFRYFYQIYCRWNICIQTQYVFTQALPVLFLFMLHDPSFNNFNYIWFGHFSIYFNLLFSHTISSWQDIAIDSRGSICLLNRASKLFCFYLLQHLILQLFFIPFAQSKEVHVSKCHSSAQIL